MPASLADSTVILSFSLVEAIKHAATTGAVWIVTPELAVCGLQFAHLVGTDWIQPQPDPWMQQVCKLNKILKRTIFLACPERDGTRLYNSVFVIDSTGDIIGTVTVLNFCHGPAPSISAAS